MKSNAGMRRTRAKDGKFVSNANVSWAVESDGVRLIRRDTAAGICLRYPQAALWDFVCRQVPQTHVRKMFAVLTKLAEEDADHLVRTTLDQWLEAGWITERDSHG